MFWEADWRIIGGLYEELDRIGKDTTGGLEHFLYSSIVAALMIPSGAEPRYLFFLFEASVTWMQLSILISVHLNCTVYFTDGIQVKVNYITRNGRIC